jgi:hypothetical protein
MEDAGLDPIVVAQAVKKAWPALAKEIEAAETAPDKNPYMLTLRLQMMSGPWKTRNRLSAVPSIAVIPEWNERHRKIYAKKGIEAGETNNLLHMMKSELEPDRGTWVSGRYLTPRLRELRAALVGIGEAVNECA